MQIKVPEYFTRFTCIADKCTDSCCVGWEIDIDAATLIKYRTIGGEIGKEIAEKTRHGHFPLAKNGRCAFLDAEGLCRIISALGEGYLCDICREHPRYYGVGAGGIEGGIGLGCPEAARLILSLDNMPEFTYIESEDTESAPDDYAEVSDSFREALYRIIYTEDAENIIGAYLTFAEVSDGIAFDLSTGGKAEIGVPDFVPAEKSILPSISKYAASLFEDCEALSNEWDNALAIAMKKGIASLDESVFKNLLFYFTHRYVRECIDDMSFGARILFSLYSALTVCSIAGENADASSYIKAATLFSKNIEYSTDNVDSVIDKIDIMPDF